MCVKIPDITAVNGGDFLRRRPRCTGIPLYQIEVLFGISHRFRSLGFAGPKLSQLVLAWINTKALSHGIGVSAGEAKALEKVCLRIKLPET